MDNGLIVGWQVDNNFEPTYWLDSTAKLGGHRDSDLIKIDAKKIDAHTIVVAQSGSGKSFFLGRLVEEILLRTKSRCLILDPNGDFSRIDKINTKIWKHPQYNKSKGIGILPHEELREFKQNWDKINKRIRTRFRFTDKIHEGLEIWWPSISYEFLAEDLDPLYRSELYHCHTFVQAIGSLCNLKASDLGISIDILETSENLYNYFNDNSFDAFKSKLEKEFSIDKKSSKKINSKQRSNISKSFKNFARRIIVERNIEKAIASIEYVSKERGKFYFAKAREYKASNIIAKAPKPINYNTRLDIIDLPSIESNRTKAMIINSILSNEWEEARDAWKIAMENKQDEDKRVPTFIVVEEAHNLIPKDTPNQIIHSIREQFRTIAAEGRKYGIFLILVSQRPDKLDPLITSECKNKIVMRLDSKTVIDLVKQDLGFDEDKELTKTLNFKKGRILIAGSWVDNQRIAFSAARRTEEGGRNLRTEYWSKPDTS